MNDKRESDKIWVSWKAIRKEKYENSYYYRRERNAERKLWKLGSMALPKESYTIKVLLKGEWEKWINRGKKHLQNLTKNGDVT